MPDPCAHCGDDLPSVGTMPRPNLCVSCSGEHDRYESKPMSNLSQPSPALTSSQLMTVPAATFRMFKEDLDGLVSGEVRITEFVTSSRALIHAALPADTVSAQTLASVVKRALALVPIGEENGEAVLDANRALALLVSAARPFSLSEAAAGTSDEEVAG